MRNALPILVDPDKADGCLQCIGDYPTVCPPLIKISDNVDVRSNFNIANMAKIWLLASKTKFDLSRV